MFEERHFHAKTVSVDTPDDPDGLKFSKLTGFDAISQCFEFVVTLQSADFNVKSTDLLGTAVTVRAGYETHERFFDGLVEKFRFVGLKDGWGLYELTLRPHLWFLSKTTDNRIFQSKTVVEIVEEILGEQSGLVFENRLSGTYPPRDYCVQYGESDLDFIQRLLEHEGIYYFHEFEDGGHTLVLVDDITNLVAVDDVSAIEFEGDVQEASPDVEVITDWDRCDSVAPGKYIHTDYDFTKPSADLMATDTLPVGHEQDDKERYSYPGYYTEMDRGGDLATIRLQEGLSPAQRIVARSTARMPWSGARFALEAYPREAENLEYCILRVDYDMRSVDYCAISSIEHESGFEAKYLLMPGDVQYRPPHTTPKSVMQGPQTAVVVGPAGEEIHTDEYSRVKVQFHWDRLGQKDENSSCWVRVSSVWAGSGWGFIQIPRIGQEVIVDFLEGDPDQPIITGRVYNAEQMPPYGLPDNATQSGWKSNSSKGGGGWNELRFEDKKGSEEVYFQAEKDHNELVKNNESRNIGNDFLENVGHDAEQNVSNDRTETVGNDKSTSVRNNRNVSIGNNDHEYVGNDRSLTVSGNETIDISGDSDKKIWKSHSHYVLINQSVTVGGWQTTKVGGFQSNGVIGWQSTTVGGYRAISVAGYQKHTVLRNDTHLIKGNQSVSVDQNQEYKIGGDQSFWVEGDGTYMVTKKAFHSSDDDATFRSNKNLILEGKDSITLKCGDATIEMKKDGTITIDGKDISAKGSGKIVVDADGSLTLKGSTINQN